MPQILKWTRDRLRQIKEYRKEGKTIAEIANLVGESHSAIDHAIIRYGLGKLTPEIRAEINRNIPKYRKWTRARLDEISKYRQQNCTAADIAALMGETLDSVRRAIKYYRIGNLTPAQRSIRAVNGVEERMRKFHLKILGKRNTMAMGRIFAAYVARELYKKGKPASSHIILSHSDKGLVSSFRDALLEVLGRKRIPIKRKKVFGKKKWAVEAYSQALAEYLHSRYWTITKILQRPSRLRSPNFWRGYIKTLFDFLGDVGKMGKRGGIKRGAVYLRLPRYLKTAGAALYQDAWHYLKYKSRKELLRFRDELKLPSNRALISQNKIARREWRRFRRIWYVEFLREILQDFGLSVTKVRFRMGSRRQRAYLSIMSDLPTVWRFTTEIGFRHKAKAARLAAMIRHIVERDKATLKRIRTHYGFPRWYLENDGKEFKKLLKKIANSEIGKKWGLTNL